MKDLGMAATDMLYYAVASDGFDGVFLFFSRIGYAHGVVPLDIWITRYTDDAEEEKLMAALDQKGQEGLIEAVTQYVKPSSVPASA